MRRSIILPLLLVAILILGSYPQNNAQGVRSASLQVFAVDPSPLGNLGLRESITFYFSRRVDCALAEAALSWSPKITNQLSCDEYSLTFTPAEAYQRDTTYTFTLAPPLAAKDGAPLLDPYRVTFSTVGYLTVSETLPMPEVEPARADSAITVVFDRPVVPLLTSLDQVALPHPLTLSPAAAGEGEWLNSSVYIFKPTKPLKNDSSYTATISANLQAVDGATMEGAYSWTFRTAKPTVLSINPEPGAPNIILDPKIQVRFNQAMDRDLVERAFIFHSRPLEDDGAVPGSFEWSDDSAGFAFMPGRRLQLDRVYEAAFSADSAIDLNLNEIGGLSSWTYHTVPAPAITATEPSQGASEVSSSSFSLFFASPMDIETLADKIRIEPAPAIEPHFYYNDWSNRYTVSFDAQPSTAYTIQVAPGMEDIYGNAITEPLTLNFSTAPLWSRLGMHIPNLVGFYNAYREPTQVYIYHRGIDHIDLALYRSPLTDFIASLTDEQYHDPAQSFDPATAELLRKWRIEPDIPENITHYQLLSLDASPSQAEDCPGAPPSRLQVGDPALVISQPDPLRARAAPLADTVLELLYRNYNLTIIGGPECAGDLRWWQVQLRDGTNAWVAEGDGAEYYLEPSASPDVSDESPADNAGGLAPGIYYLEMSSPNLEHSQSTKHFLNVSTAVLTIKQAADRLTIWAVDVNSGAPIVGETIKIYGEDAALLAAGNTDERGILQADIPYTRDRYTGFVALLDTEQHFGFGYSNWSNGTEPWQFGYRSSFFPRAYRAYLYTDRPVYRTGQPLYFRGIVRRKDDVLYPPPSLATVPVTIHDPRGEIVYQQDLPLSEFGSFNGTFDIAPEASLGTYRISVKLPSDLEFIEEGASIGFLVAEYRLPEYQVTLEGQPAEIVQGDSAEFVLKGEYFFGGPVSQAPGEYTIFSSPYVFNYSGEGRYDFIDHDLYQDRDVPYTSNNIVTEGKLQTDASGEATFGLLGTLPQERGSQFWRVEASITDEANQTTYGSSSLVLHQGLFYLGVRAADYVSRANEDSLVNIIAVDWDSQPLANQQVDVQVVERRWTSVQEQDPNTGRTAWTWDVEEIPITSGNVTTNADGKAVFSYQPPNGGIFKIIVTARDTAGNQVRSATYSWVSSPSYVSWRQGNDNTIALVPDKTDYSIGETAKILITSPYQGEAEALVSIERGDVLNIDHITLDSNSQIYEFDILPEHAPNIFVSVFLVKAVDEHDPVASWRMGMTQLQVDIEEKALTIDISADRDTAAPQETVEYRFRVSDYKGDPVVAELGIGLTDLAALSLAARNSPALLTRFYGPQALSVHTSSSLVFNADAVTEELSEQKGGGGGIFESGIIDLRGEFIDTPYWNPTVLTDANGEATVDLKLPDNLTTWRLDARALTAAPDGQLLLGEQTLDLLSTRPLLIRPQTPRFFIVGDRAQLAAVIHNNTDRAISAQVSLENSAGLTLATGEGWLQAVTIPAAGRTRVTWQVTVADVASVAPYFLVRSADDVYRDASISPVGADFDGTLPVYRYQVPETVGTAGLLREAGSRVEALLLPRDYDTSAGQLEIRLDKSLAGITTESLDYLERETKRYWECTSTIVSRFLPNIASYRALKALDLAQAELKAKLDALVSEALQELYARQRADGGWSWCAYPEGHTPTTAYALIGLAQAQNQGYPVDENVIRRAQRYLQHRLITPSVDLPPWQLNRQAFLLFALATSGAPDIARSSILFENRERLNLDAIAFLAQTLHIINPDDRLRLDSLAEQMLNNAVTRATGTFFEESYQDRRNWSSDIRSTALVLDALLKIQPQSDLLPNILRYLVSARTGKNHWGSPQENTWSIIALTNWMLASGELNPSYSYSVALNDRLLLSDLALPREVLEADVLRIDLAQLIPQESNLLEFQRGDGTGPLYYTAHLNLDLTVPELKSQSRGIEISRRYTLLGDEADAATETIERAIIGDTVQVRLRIVAPNTLRYVVIEDYFPAGAEAINPDLAISPQLGTMPRGERIDSQQDGWGWWFFDHVEFRDEKAVIYASHLPRGVYEFVYTIQPTVAGEYNVIPPVAQELYFPEVYGRGDGARFTILETILEE